MKTAKVVLMLSLALASSVSANELEFRAFFDEWVSLEQAFDPVLAELTSVEVTMADRERDSAGADAGYR